MVIPYGCNDHLRESCERTPFQLLVPVHLPAGNKHGEAEHGERHRDGESIPHPTLSCTQTRAVDDSREPRLMEKKNQLKNEPLFTRSAGSAPSNWSAPRAEVQGLMPPDPMAMR